MKKTDIISGITLPIKGAHETRCIAADDLVFGAHVRAACEANACGMYGKSWTCPPHCGAAEALRNKLLRFEHALIFTTLGPLEDSFDIEGMDRARTQSKHLLANVAEQFRAQAIPFLPLGCGACDLCGACACPDAPCRFPGRAILSVEACGIDVVETARRNAIQYYNGINTVTCFNIILF